jgi:hypothetical protein
MKYLIIGFCLLSMGAMAQDYEVIHFASAHAPFPDTSRDGGHLDGDSIFQPRAGHYNDSSVLIVVPRGFKAGSKVDLVFWFHGWHNNIDTALRFYGLARQFAASGVNAILVLPEAAAVCSGGGGRGACGGGWSQWGGGTDEVSDAMMGQLRQKGIHFELVEEGLVTSAVLGSNKVLFVHSPREHNVIINDPDDFRLLLENSHFLTR